MRVEEVPDPVLRESTDAVVRVGRTASATSSSVWSRRPGRMSQPCGPELLVSRTLPLEEAGRALAAMGQGAAGPGMVVVVPWRDLGPW